MAKGSLPILPVGLTAAQYEGIFAGAGTYQGNKPGWKGKTWGDVYHALLIANQSAAKPESPYQLALKVEELIFLQGSIGALVTSIGNFVAISGKSAIGGIDNVLSTPLGTIANFFSILTSKGLWIRVGEFAVGGILLYVGLKAIATPAGQQVSQTSGKQVLTHHVKRVAGLVK